MRHSLAFGILFVSLTLARGGDTWPQFRGPTGDGHADAHDLPTRWSETENIRWKTEIHGKGWSSPVIWGNQIWLTTATEDGKQKFAVCVERSSGKVLHDILLFPEEKPAFCIPFNSYATPTPTIEEGRVYVHFGSAGTACLDTATGHVLWRQTSLKCDHWRGPGSSPMLYGKLLILTFDGHDVNYLAALNTETGDIVWKKDRGIPYTSNDGDYHKAYSTPTLLEQNGQPQLVSPAADATIAYDPRSGDELWRVYHGGMNEACKPVVGNGLIFLSSGHTKNLLARAARRQRRPDQERRMEDEQGRAHALLVSAGRRPALFRQRRRHRLVRGGEDRQTGMAGTAEGRIFRVAAAGGRAPLFLRRCEQDPRGGAGPRIPGGGGQHPRQRLHGLARSTRRCALSADKDPSLLHRAQVTGSHAEIDQG